MDYFILHLFEFRKFIQIYTLPFSIRNIFSFYFKIDRLIKIYLFFSTIIARSKIITVILSAD